MSTVLGTFDLTLTGAEFEGGLLLIDLAFEPDSISGGLRLLVLAPGGDLFGATTVLEAVWPEVPTDDEGAPPLPD